MRYIGYLKRCPDETLADFKKRSKKHKGYLETMFHPNKITIKIGKTETDFWVGK